MENSALISAQKQVLRAQFRQARLEISVAEKKQRDQKMTEIFCQSEIYTACTVLLCYAAQAAEPETRWILEDALEKGKIVALPKSFSNRVMNFYPLSAARSLASQLIPGKFGILEPISQIPLSEHELEKAVCLVPCLAVDARGYRLGYGGGYYDTWMKSFPNIAYLGFVPEDFCVDVLPVYETDRQLNGRITERTSEVWDESRSRFRRITARDFSGNGIPETATFPRT